MEEMLDKFIDEGKREHEKMMTFIYDFQITNELLFKERNNSLLELRFGVQELLKVLNNILMIDCDVKGVTTRGGQTTTQDVHDNNTNMTSEPVVQPPNKVQTPPVPFPRRLRKEKEEAQQKKFLENLKQLHINFPFIEALAQILKYSESSNGNNESDLKSSIRRIDSANTLYPVTQGATKHDDVKSEHLYLASANKIDEKKPKLKNFLNTKNTYTLTETNPFPLSSHPNCPKRENFTSTSIGETCMAVIFHDMVEDFMEVFMDDFSVFGSSFDCCLANLDRMLARCEETNLVLN
ncbi:hypothetical protein Tco_1350460 [Tanacetum coccineum]